MALARWSVPVVWLLAAAAVAAGGGGPGAGGAAVGLGGGDFHPSPARPVGFRGDWTGNYVGASPPLGWSPTDSVLWKTQVGEGEPSPIVVGDRVFVLSDGIRVDCLSRTDGKVLWHREHHVRPDAAADAAADAAVWRLEEYVLLHHRRRPLEQRQGELARALAGLRAEADRVRRKPDGARVAELEKRLAECREEMAPLAGRIEALVELPVPENRSGQYPKGQTDERLRSATTWAIATPCSDGRFVYVWMPTGVLACYDLQGKARWVRILGRRRAVGGWYGGQVAPSPLLADGKLVIHYDRIYCLDAATGEVLWETPQKLLPIPSPVAGRRNGHWYVALGSGQVLRMSDGKYIHGGEATPCHDCVGVGSPVFYGDCFCWVSHALQLPEDADGRPKLLWTLDAGTHKRLVKPGYTPGDEDDKPFTMRGMGWHGYASPVQHDGLLYYHHEAGTYSVLDARTGRWLYTRTLSFQRLKGRGGRCGGDVYPSLTLAGGLAFATGGGGATMVVKTGREKDFAVVAENALSRLGGNMLVFHGRQMFVRAGRWVYCFGPRE